MFGLCPLPHGIGSSSRLCLLAFRLYGFNTLRFFRFFTEVKARGQGRILQYWRCVMYS